MDNQTNFLSTIRRALGEAPNVKRSKETYPKLFPPHDSDEITTKIAARDEADLNLLVEQLRGNCPELNIESHLCTSSRQAADVVVELIRSKQPEFNHTKHVLLHDHPDIAALKLWNRFNHEAVTLHTTFANDQQGREKAIASFIGITVPEIAVAESATLVQLTEPGRPNSTSLLPSIHIAMVRRENLVADLAEAYALLAMKSIPNNFVFISSPSKTADIESQMVHGAHGPRELHLLILAEPLSPREISLKAEETVETSEEEEQPILPETETDS